MTDPSGRDPWQRHRPRLGRRWRATWAAAMTLALVAAAPYMYVQASSYSRIYGATETPPDADVALVLGARVYPDGTPSLFLKNRVKRAVELYDAGVVGALLMSGDDDTLDGTDQVAAMRDLALAAGVPDEDILIDGAGFDTFQSCVNARDNFGLDRVLLVSQDFHLPRAVWLCRQAGIEAEGTSPPARATWHTLVSNIREVPASFLAVWEVVTGRDSGRDSGASS